MNLKPDKNILRASSFVSDVLKLSSGATIAQVIVIFAAPVITRLYNPDAFGIFALYSSISSILAGIACLNYELTLPLPEKDEDAANLLALCLILAGLISALTVPVILLGGGMLIGLLGAPGLGPYLWLVPISVFMSGVFSALLNWNTRTKYYGRISIAKVTNQITSTSTQLGAGLAGYATGGSIIASSLLGTAASLLMLGGQTWKYNARMIKDSVRPRSILAGARNYKKFPLVVTWSSLLNNISWQLPTFLLSIFFTPTVVGQYAIGMMVIQLPMNLIGGAISQVFFQRASKAKSEGNLATLTEGTFRVLLMLITYPMLILTVLGADLFVFLFGNAWYEAGTYIQILSLWSSVWFISYILEFNLIVLEKQTIFLKLNILIFSTRLVSLLIGGILGSARLSIALFAISGVFVYGYVTYAAIVYSGASRSNILKIILSNLASLIPTIIILTILKFIGVSFTIQFLIALIFALLYYIGVIKKNRHMIDMFKYN